MWELGAGSISFGQPAALERLIRGTERYFQNQNGEKCWRKMQVEVDAHVAFCDSGRARAIIASAGEALSSEPIQSNHETSDVKVMEAKNPCKARFGVG